MIVKPVGIENVVNWQDNGVFADTQKQVADDNYTLAGDVNQDNLYVGYMKEHGLKGKLSLPVLSSLGAITGRQTIGDCEVYKHVNGTTIIKGAVINPNLPDSRISLGFSADENGLQYYNNPNDPMPIKTINMAGLQKWEETDDYIIYVDKDAVMTTVENYQVGAYDLFLERKTNVDVSMELLKENGIEWTSSDDSMLMLDVNEQLYRKSLLRDSINMLPGDIEIQSTTRAVPTTYECCFRTDKKSGEIYIGEGYENLVSRLTFQDKNFTTFDITKKLFFTNKTEEGGYCYSAGIDNDCLVEGATYTTVIIVDETKNVVLAYTSSNCIYGNVGSSIKTDYGFYLSGECLVPDKPSSLFLKFSDYITTTNAKWQITKTSTPKPFVKSVMPNGKLSFVTNATAESHSFIGKGLEFTGVSPTFYRCAAQPNASAYEYIKPNPKAHSIAIVSTYANLSSKNGTDWLNSTGGNFGLSTGYVSLSGVDYTYDTAFFKQLLIYKGNLTEAELKAENEKEINVGAYYHQENSVTLTYGIDSMKAMRVYSPALTDIEIAEEVNKNIYIPENRDGVPNYLGEVK